MEKIETQKSSFIAESFINGAFGALAGAGALAAVKYNIGQHVPASVSDIFSRYSPISTKTLADVAAKIDGYTDISSLGYLGISSIIGVSAFVKTFATALFERYEEPMMVKKTITDLENKEKTIDAFNTKRNLLNNVLLYTASSVAAIVVGSATGIYLLDVAAPAAFATATVYPIAHAAYKAIEIGYAILCESSCCKKVENKNKKEEVNEDV